MRAKKISIQVVTVLFMILIIGVQPVPTILAASEGPLYPSTGTSVTAGEGTTAWTGPGNIAADDDVEAQVDLDAGQISEYLQGTDFGFAIPTGATITGIEVTIGRSSSGSNGNPIEDHSIMLVKGGSLTGDNNAALGVKWPANHIEAARVYSPPDPLWGTTWTAEEINAADFGAAISVINPDSAARSGFVDYINISVSYFTPTSLTVSPIIGTYGDNADFSATLTPAVSGKTIIFTINGGAACSAPTNAAGLATCQAQLLTNVGSYPDGVGASFSGDEEYLGITEFADVIISPRPITVTADAQTKVYGDSDPLLSYTITSGSLVGSDAFTGALTHSGVNVGIYAITQGTLTAGSNYTLTYVGDNMTITAREITVTADAQTKVYGDSDPLLSYTVTSGSLVGSDAFTGALTHSGVNVGIYAITQGTLTLGSNYTLTYIGDNMTITARPITVTADAQTKVYGDGDPLLSYTVTSGSLVGSDAFSGALTRDSGENVGTYAITQDTLALSSNYSLTYVGDNLTITARPITVTAYPQTKVYGDSDPALTYMFPDGSLVGSDAFTGALTRDSGENVGTYAITQGTLTLSSNYSLTYVGANLTITRRFVTVTANNISKMIGKPDPWLTYLVTEGSLLPEDSFIGSLTREPGEAPGTYQILRGSLALQDNYQLNFIGADFIIYGNQIFMPFIVH